MVKYPGWSKIHNKKILIPNKKNDAKTLHEIWRWQNSFITFWAIERLMGRQTDKAKEYMRDVEEKVTELI